jgi:nucleoside-diphosphate-sugar epimerase
MKTIGIFGVNGFIGHHLVQRILQTTDWKVIGADLSDSRIKKFVDNDRFVFKKVNIREDHQAIEELIVSSDIVLPLAAIATPSLYIERPLWVFELDFEANLRIVRSCVKNKKRVIWPSTSEVYGMCADNEFDPEKSSLVMGPINKERWIYASAKQLMDRVVWAYGSHEGLDFTIFRPFNWVGSGLDDIHNVGASGARAITQFLGNMLLDRDIVLVDGGHQRRSFTYVGDGVDALIRIIENEDGIAKGKIYNIGNPKNDMSIKEFAEIVYTEAAKYPVFAQHLSNVKVVVKDGKEHYGTAYQDMFTRVPLIENTERELGWSPRASVEEMVNATLVVYQEELGSSEEDK